MSYKELLLFKLIVTSFNVYESYNLLPATFMPKFFIFINQHIKFLSW